MTSISHLRFVFFLFFFLFSAFLQYGFYPRAFIQQRSKHIRHGVRLGRKKRIPPYTTTSTLSDLIYIVFFSHWMTAPYDYHHHLLLRAGSQHSAKKMPPYHTIPYHTIPHHTVPHSKTAFSPFLVHIRDRQATERAFFCIHPKTCLVL